MFMGVIFATLRRQIRLYVKKFAGANAATLLAPIDETGNTLPADGSFMSPKVVAQKKAEAEAEAVKAKSVPARSQREPTGGVIEKKETDFAVTAFRVVQEATHQLPAPPEKPLLTEGKNPNAVALGRLGGLKGGKARASKMTPERRKEVAQKAAKARWDKK